MTNTIPKNTRVRVKIPSKMSYLPKLATVISMTTDGKVVVQFDEPLFVEGIFEYRDILSVRPEKVVAL